MDKAVTTVQRRQPAEIGTVPFASRLSTRFLVLTVAFVALAVDPSQRPRVRVSAEEAAAHAARLAGLQKKAGRCLWLELEPGG